MHSTNQTESPKERELFLRALEKTDPGERSAYLNVACGGEVDLRARLERLLAGFAGLGAFLEEPAVAVEPCESGTLETSDLLTHQPVGAHGHERVGRYKLLQKVGEGGCGVVYVAEQEEPVRRRVALKVIKLGMDTRSVIARFEAERQALALMDHPNIARVLDAGATDTGRPYFVMELVRGIKITEYCDQAKLRPGQRLELFIQVCHAIQHAHQKGIIHRDIKPSNILVTLHDGVPVPKVIDFGIAKATADQRLTDKTVYTELQQFIGTPAYMSPEQAEMSGLDIDTRTDIYSLGVLLYEMLVGRTPFDAKELLASGLDEMRRTIREKEPTRPSTRLRTMVDADQSTTAQDRGIEAPNLIHLLSGDLDWIVMKCLEKDRARRYETANGLARDIQRHLANEPVVARPPSAVYRVRKFVRRNRAIVMAGSAVAAVLVLGVLVSTWQAVRATLAEKQESAQHHRADEALGLAQAQELAARQRAYAADMQVALQAWDEGDLNRAETLLAANCPAPGQSDLRGFEWRYLRHLCRDESHLTLGGPARPLRGAVFLSSDLLLLNDERALRIRDLIQGGEQLLLQDPAGIWRVCLCPGKTNLLATATDDGEVKVWNLDVPGQPQLLDGHPHSQIHSLVFSPDGRWLASASSDKSVKLWDVSSRNSRAVHTVGHYSYFANGVAFSADGGTLFSSGSETMVRAWNVVTGAEAAGPLQGHTAWVYVLAASADGRWLASGSGDSAVALRNAVTGEPLKRLLGHEAHIEALAFSPDGRLLASGGPDRIIRLWDLVTGQSSSLLRGHYDRISGLAFAPDGRSLVSHSGDGVVKLWEISVGSTNVLTGNQDWLEEVALSPGGRLLAAVSVDSSTVSLWDLPTRTRNVLSGHSQAAMCAAFSPDGKLLATGSHDQTVRLWDVATRSVTAVLTNHFPVGSLGFSPNGATLVAGGSKYHFLVDSRAGLAFWDVRAQQTRGSLPGDMSDAIEVAWSPTGSLLATGHADGSVSLWDPESRRQLRRFPNAHDGGVICLAFSPVAPLLASSDWSGNIQIYDTAKRVIVQPAFKAHTWRLMSLAFSPDGTTLASAGEGGVKLWHVPSFRVALALKNHTGTVPGVAFSRDANLMITCGADATVRLWPAVSVQEMLSAAPAGR